MSKEKQLVIKEANITNNCPKCFNQELRLTFFQKHIYTSFFHRTTADVTHQIMCVKCESKIYPVDWTPDIERVFEYYNKLVTPSKPAVRFTRLFYILVISILLLISIGIYFYIKEFA